MADAKKCDICGKLYESYHAVKIDGCETFKGCVIKFTNEHCMCFASLDLCPGCMTKVQTVLHSIMCEKEKQHGGREEV
jgi:hypothetical protein